MNQWEELFMKHKAFIFDIKELKESFRKSVVSYPIEDLVYDMSSGEIIKSYDEVINLYEKAFTANRGLLFTF